MSESSEINLGSNGFCFLRPLTILFIGLKLTGYIAWPWFYVLSPLMVSVLMIMVVAFICADG